MDADKIIALVEKYLRDFVLYLLSFFMGTAETDAPSAGADLFNSSLIFSILSTVLGAYLWDRYILSLSGKQADVLGLVTDSLLMWASLGLVLYLMLRAVSLRVNVLAPVLSVLKIFSVSHVVAIYAAYIVVGVCFVFMTASEYAQVAQRGAFLASYAIELVLIWTYLPKEVRAAAPIAGAWRLHSVTVVFLVLVSFVIAVRGAGYLYDASQAGAVKQTAATAQGAKT